MIEIRYLKKVFKTRLRGEKTALEGITLTVKDGEFFVLLGPSGSGKSTLLNLIAGLEKPTEGEILIDGKVVSSPSISVPPAERGVSMVFQSYALYPHMRVKENLAFPLKVAGSNRDEIARRVEEVAELLEIKEILNAYPHELSGGERQRVALGRALVRKPKILLLDEPLSNLDAILRMKMRGELKGIQRATGVTALYVTHDQTEALSLADRLAVMNQGRIEQVGNPLDVYNDPATPFVAGFIGNPPMNLYRKRVERDGKRSFVRIFGKKYEVNASDTFVTVGFRPEWAQTTEGQEIEIKEVERLGDETLLHVKGGEDRGIIKVHGDHTFKKGQRIGLRIKKIHLFH